jgi:hypothetical protein
MMAPGAINWFLLQAVANPICLFRGAHPFDKVQAAPVESTRVTGLLSILYYN